MASNNSFTLNGATPNMGYTPPLKAGQSAFPSQGTFASNITPMTNPLSVFGSKFQTSTPSTTPAMAALNRAASPAPAPAPTTPVKKTTVNNVDGSSHVTEYHAPTPTPGLVNANAGYDNAAMAKAPQGTPVQTPNTTPGENPYSYPGLIKRVADAGSQAKTQQSQTADEIAGLRTNLATDTGVVLDQPQELNFQTGRINALQTQEAAKESALNEKLQAETAANTQNLNGLTTAAGLMSPSNQFIQAPYSNQILGADGQPVAGSGTLPKPAMDAVNLQIQKVKNNNATLAEAVSALSAYGQPAVNALQAGLGTGFNSGVNAGAVSSAQQNTQTSGTAGVQANQTVFNKAYGDYKNLENAVQNVDQFGQLLVKNMGGINPSDAKYANQTIAQVRGQLSSAQQATFDTTLAALTSKVSGLLSVGGNEIPTDISADSRKIIDGSLPIGSLTSVLSRIQQEGNILLTNQANLVNSAYSGVQGNQNQNANQSITWDSLLK